MRIYNQLCICERCGEILNVGFYKPATQITEEDKKGFTCVVDRAACDLKKEISRPDTSGEVK